MYWHPSLLIDMQLLHGSEARRVCALQAEAQAPSTHWDLEICSELLVRGTGSFTVTEIAGYWRPLRKSFPRWT